MSAEFFYTGKVEGNLETTNTGKPVFKGVVGEVPVWVYGKQGKTLNSLVGRYVLIKGDIESRTTENGRVFPRLHVFSVAPADPKHQLNFFVIRGEVEANKHIRDGLYETLVSVSGVNYVDGKRVNTKYNLPVTNSKVVDSDIGRTITVTGRMVVRQGKFTDLIGEGISVFDTGNDSTLDDDVDLL